MSMSSISRWPMKAAFISIVVCVSSREESTCRQRVPHNARSVVCTQRPGSRSQGDTSAPIRSHACTALTSLDRSASSTLSASGGTDATSLSDGDGEGEGEAEREAEREREWDAERLEQGLDVTLHTAPLVPVGRRRGAVSE